MKISDNTSLTTFLLGHPIQIFVADDNGVELFNIEFNIPTVKQIYCDKKIQTILGVLNTDTKTLQSKFTQIKNFTHYDLFTVVNQFKIKDLSVYAEYLEYTFAALGMDLKCDNKMTINGHTINEEIFEYIRYTLLYSAKMKDKNSLQLEQDENYRAAQERINKIKNQNKNVDKDKIFSKNYITLLYEFGLSPSEIERLNLYQYENILGYTNNSIQYKVSLIAAGNGNTKKVKFITKGDK